MNLIFSWSEPGKSPRSEGRAVEPLVTLGAESSNWFCYPVRHPGWDKLEFPASIVYSQICWHELFQDTKLQTEFPPLSHFSQIKSPSLLKEASNLFFLFFFFGWRGVCAKFKAQTGVNSSPQSHGPGCAPKFPVLLRAFLTGAAVTRSRHVLSAGSVGIFLATNPGLWLWGSQ